MSGRVSYLAGLAAEDSVARDYRARGGKIADRRWRGRAGEIDLIVRCGDEVVFVEVKKSRDFHRAAERLTRRQMERIYLTAAEYLEHQPAGQLTPARFDVALVNQRGEVQIVENAIAA